MRNHLAFHPLQISEHGEQHERDNRDLDERDDEKCHYWRTYSSLSGCAWVKRFSITEFSILEYRPSVPDVKRLSCADQIKSGRLSTPTLPFTGAVCCAPTVTSASGMSYPFTVRRI